MSLAMVWSYFHALRESESPLARHFVVVAPNLTVFERLREDFKPAQGGPDIFDRDPLIPVAWRGDWNLTTVLQDEAGGAATGGTLYLTNIHRLHDTSERRKREPETYGWMGPAVSRAKALDTGAALRARVTNHEAQRAFFEPDLSALPKKDAEMCERRGSDLKRTLVDHNGMSPIGLLRWCLQFARESGSAPSAALESVRRHFAGVDAEIYALVNRINTFRNDYIAHQYKELTDAGLARDSLREWSRGVARLWEIHRSEK